VQKTEALNMNTKTIQILRHAKTEAGFHKQDKDRVLTSAGHERAAALATIMNQNADLPLDLILCSTAQRTRQTAAPIVDMRHVPIKYLDDMYLASAGQLYEIIKNVDDDIDHIMLVGHNPSMHQIVSFLAVSEQLDKNEEIRFSYPTGTLTALSFENKSWSGIMPQTGHIERVFME